jgi:photosystem II stability/assembly factor-like uncharacterized protein
MMKLFLKFTILRRVLLFNALTFFTILTFLYAPAQLSSTSANERLSGLQKRNKLLMRSVLDTIKFRNIGPSIMSGRVVDIDVNPKDPTEFYTAYATGGLWHTINNGQSFVPIFDTQYVSCIGDIAVNWKTGEIWVGTGEANSSRSSYSGVGVYKSNDTGRTWQYLGLPESHHIGKIVLHPTDPQIAWVAVTGHLYSPNKERGVYKTTDGGKKWKQVLYVNENTGAIDMDINFKDPDELIACMWYKERRAWNFVESGSSSGIYKSSDGGETWKLVTTPNSGFPTGDGVGRTGVSIFQGNPQIVYACVDNQNRRPDTATKKVDSSTYALKDFKNISKEDFLKLNPKRLDSFFIKNNFDEKYNDSTVKEMVRNNKIKPSAIYDYLADENSDIFQTPVIGCEVYKSEDGGMNWKKVNTKGLDLYNTYGYYFGKISVSPVNQNKVLISGFNLMMSTDGGKTFKVTDKPTTHPDWHACWINPSRDSNWVAGNDGGCNITYDNGAHWFKANTPPVAQFYAIDVDNAKPYHVYGGIQDNGVWYGPSDYTTADEWNYENADVWKNIGGGDGMQVQVDRRDNKTVFIGSQFGYYERISTAEKDNKRSIHPMPDLGEQQLRYNWQTPILLSRHNEDILYFGTNRFYRTMNKGNKFIPLSGDLTKGKKKGDVPFGTMTTLSESPLRFGLLYCGTDDGNIHVSKDGGYTWTLVSSKLPQNMYISRVVASQYKESRVYATLNGYRFDNFTPLLFVSEDYGKTWSALGQDLPLEPLNVVREDPKKEDILYVGSDNDLYASFDRGKTFMTFGNLPRVPVHDIAIQTTANEIVVATHGRSIYVAPLKEVHKIFDASKK